MDMLCPGGVDDFLLVLSFRAPLRLCFQPRPIGVARFVAREVGILHYGVCLCGHS